jgi:hypothetical protein
MAKIIIYTNENGNVSVCIPTGELSIEEVLAKDCPESAFIVDETDIPQDQTYFNAWEIVNGIVVVNQAKKQAIIDAAQAIVDTKQSALNKLMALGLTESEALALGVK